MILLHVLAPAIDLAVRGQQRSEAALRSHRRVKYVKPISFSQLKNQQMSAVRAVLEKASRAKKHVGLYVVVDTCVGWGEAVVPTCLLVEFSSLALLLHQSALL